MKIALFAGAILCALTLPAFAADLPDTKGPPAYAPPPPPVFSWTGFYIGAQAGYEWGRTGGTLFSPAGATDFSVSANDGGVVGGGHAGYNVQYGQFVVGVEGDVNGSSYDGSVIGPAGTHLYRTRIPIDGSVRGRIGYAFDRVLVYATGGAAFADIRNNVTDLVTGAVDEDEPGRVGWTVGGGIEYAVDNNWSLRAEYRYTDYGHYSYPLSNTTPGPVTLRVHETDNRVQAGFSYKLDWFEPPAPVAAKY